MNSIYYPHIGKLTNPGSREVLRKEAGKGRMPD